MVRLYKPKYVRNYYILNTKIDRLSEIIRMDIYTTSSAERKIIYINILKYVLFNYKGRYRKNKSTGY